MTSGLEEYKRRRAEQDASNKSRLAERRWFGWWRNPPDRFAFLIAIFTAGLFAATAGLWVATKDLVRDAQMSGRAWMVPHLLRLEKPLKPGEDASLLLFYGNSGKEPSLQVRHYHEGGAIPSAALAGDVASSTKRVQDAIARMDIPDTCERAAKNVSSGVVYPTPIDASTNSVTVDQKWITDDVVNGFGLLIVKGCIIYETIKLIHKSRYCFFYNGKIAELRPPEHRAYLQSCPGEKENDAD